MYHENNRRRTKRALEKEFLEIRNMESSIDSNLKDAYLNNLAFLQEELTGNEAP